jgi:hypothetical protein
MQPAIACLRGKRQSGRSVMGVMGTKKEEMTALIEVEKLVVTGKRREGRVQLLLATAKPYSMYYQ